MRLPKLGPLRIAGLSWFVYIAVGAIGALLKSPTVDAVSSATYMVPMILVYRIFSPADPLVALLLLPIEGFAAGLQAAGQLRDDVDMQKLALLVFAVGFVVLGYLVARSRRLPALIGYLMVLGAVAWSVAMIPAVPLPLARVLQGAGFLTEGVFVLSLLLARSSSG